MIVVTVVLTLYLIYLLRQPLTWLVIAAFLALALSAPVGLLDRHMPRGLAIAVVYLALILIPIGLGAAIVPSLVSEAEELVDNLPEYASDLQEFVNDNESLRALEEDYDLTGRLEEEARELPARFGDAAGILGDIGGAGEQRLRLRDDPHPQRLHARRRATVARRRSLARQDPVRGEAMRRTRRPHRARPSRATSAVCSCRPRSPA